MRAILTSLLLPRSRALGLLDTHFSAFLIFLRIQKEVDEDRRKIGFPFSSWLQFALFWRERKD